MGPIVVVYKITQTNPKSEWPQEGSNNLIHGYIIYLVRQWYYETDLEGHRRVMMATGGSYKPNKGELRAMQNV